MPPKSGVRALWSALLVYTLFVILFGAIVRITGSGDGCGQHWPTCHGDALHLSASRETWIEQTHRLTSGLNLVFLLVVVWRSFRGTVPRAPLRRAALWTLGFMIVEALVGAALVLLRLVGNNDSVGRAIIMAIHLVNTSLLLWAMLYARFLAETPGGRASSCVRWEPRARRLLGLGASLLLVTMAFGAVTALGDTLYPVSPTEKGLAVAEQSLSASAHFLLRMRALHPFVATATVVFVLWVTPSLGGPEAARARVATLAIALVSVGVGLINIWLSAPGYLQVIHLALANLFWLAWGRLGLASAEATARGIARSPHAL